MPRISVTDTNGVAHTVEVPVGYKIMEALREYEWGVAAACGGFCSCATCHVYVDSAWLPKLEPMLLDEKELVTTLSTYRPESSRLSCQLQMRADLDGIVLTIAPEE
jgi:ferredoxin, 2Fe-2S